MLNILKADSTNYQMFNTATIEKNRSIDHLINQINRLITKYDIILIIMTGLILSSNVKFMI